MLCAPALLPMVLLILLYYYNATGSTRYWNLLLDVYPKYGAD